MLIESAKQAMSGRSRLRGLARRKTNLGTMYPYRVLVHGSTHSTYVAEQNLALDDCLEPISHPMIELFFSKLQQGQYSKNEPLN